MLCYRGHFLNKLMPSNWEKLKGLVEYLNKYFSLSQFGPI